ncbi:Putative glycosyltransferase 3 [Triticum urartu]|uniref:Xyloglucan 6-xylosyltransferase n=2 Tax=Triticum TaxID=4564 RepID=A0A9R0WKZ0_TRITD|nr:Putative glycosyltransferase 3 [Triticum urartu]VAI15537.1 unnamed protein product [Triticum turgidum subsp. durum]
MAAGGLGRPGRPGRGGNKQMQKTINNVKITLICGFITILVLRGTVGINLIAFSGDGGGDAAADAKVAEDIERILREIRSDSDPDDEDQLVVDASLSGNSTAMPVVEEKNYTLGPSITRWNAKRRQWLSQNPGFPSRDARGNPRILLVTGSSPGPCDNPAGDHYLLKSTKNKIDYCRLHGIEIVHNMVHLDRELSGYWSKLPLLRRLMLSHPEVEWVWWMDSDALFTDMGFEIPLSRYEGSNLVIHGYPELLNKQRSWVYVENQYYLHGFWAGLVDKYEEMMEKHHPGLGDERWPFITHFVGCKPCGSYGDYPVEQCLTGMERAFNFADNQVLRLYGFRHRSLTNPKVKPVANRTASPLLNKEASLKMDAKIET